LELEIEKWLAEHPEEDRFKHQFLDKNAYEVLAEIGVKGGQTVLDFGCGSGTYTIPAAKLVGKKGKIYALDIDVGFLDEMEEKAKQEGLENIMRIDASGEGGISLEDESTDIMLLIDVLHEIDDRESLFDEAYRILKPRGVVSVYPMHVAEEEVERLATGRGLNLEDRKFQERILIFKKKK
jgi:ubiquinone/menaquinone biosynthesis C-methylase UbiE